MNKEQITKILSKIKDTVGENNYKLALAITGHRTGKIKEIIMCSKDGELLLEYVEQLKKDKLILKEQLESSEKARKEAIELLEKHLEAKSYSNHKYEFFSREYLEELLKILDIDKGE